MSKKPPPGAPIPRARASVRAVAAISFVALAVAAIGMVVIVERTITRYHEGDATLVRHLGVRSLSPVQAAFIAQERLAAFNEALLENSSAVLQPRFVQEMDPPQAELAVVVRHGTTLHYPEDLAGKFPHAVLAAQLPEFGAPVPARDEIFQSDLYVLARWDFRAQDGVPASFFVVRVAPERLTTPPPGPTPGLAVVGFVLVLFVLIAGLLGFAFLQQVLAPIRKLEQAAARLGMGDFSDPPEPLRSSPREIAHVLDAFRTMRRQLRDYVERQRRDAESRRQLIANLSHDLKTPITTIKGYLEGLQQGIADTPEKREHYLATAARRVGELEQLVRQLLSLATVETHDVPFSFRPVDLSAELPRMLADLRAAFDASQLTLMELLPDAAGGVWVSADLVQLRRAIDNLVENAVKYAHVRPVVVQVHVMQANGHGVILVCDNGHGIADEQLERVFERSFRLNPNRNTGGAGLGLTIARQIVRLHGGTIQLENKDGLCARIEIPLLEELT